MSIYVENKDEVYEPHCLVAEGHIKCFLCGERIKKTAIHWMGASSASEDGTHDIYFHPCCCMSFIRRLMQDLDRYFTNDPKMPLDNTPYKP